MKEIITLFQLRYFWLNERCGALGRMMKGTPDLVHSVREFTDGWCPKSETRPSITEGRMIRFDLIVDGDFAGDYEVSYHDYDRRAGFGRGPEIVAVDADGKSVYSHRFVHHTSAS